MSMDVTRPVDQAHRPRTLPIRDKDQSRQSEQVVLEPRTWYTPQAVPYRSVFEDKLGRSDRQYTDNPASPAHSSVHRSLARVPWKPDDARSRCAEPPHQPRVSWTEPASNDEDDLDSQISDESKDSITSLKNATPDLLEFLNLSLHDFKQVLEFVAAHPSIKALPEQYLRGLGADALRANDTDLSRRIVERTVILKRFREPTARTYFRGLMDKNPDTLRLHYETIDREYNSLKLQEGVRKPKAPSRRAEQVRLAVTEPWSTNSRSRDMPTPPKASRTTTGLANFGYEHDHNVMVPPSGLSISDSVHATKLISGYTVQPKKFFHPGQVFATLWHETAGTSTARLLSEYSTNTNLTMHGVYGESVFAHIRHFIVVRSRTSFCWCIAISTYNGRGLSKPGLKPDDVQAHAIIYDKSKAVTLLPNEPEIKKRPIPIIVRPSATLRDISRAHCGKPYSVEYNIKVKPVGEVSSDHLQVLLRYVKDELF